MELQKFDSEKMEIIGRVSCPHCDGKGEYFSDGDGWCISMWKKCYTCNGFGNLNYVKDKR